MKPTKEEWLQTAKANSKGDGRAVCKWAYAMVQAADIPEESKSVALIEAMRMLQLAGLRGDISEHWVDCGFTNEQFNYELFL